MGDKIVSTCKIVRTDAVRSVLFSGDGALVYFGNGDDESTLGPIDICYFASGELFQRLLGHTGGVRSLCLSRNGKLLASGSYDKSVKLWDLESFLCTATLEGHTNWIIAVKLSVDLDMVFSGSEDSQIKIWDCGKKAVIRTLKDHKGPVKSLAVFADGSRLASSSNDFTIKLWAIATGLCTHTLTGHTNYVYSIVILPSQLRIVSGARDNTIKLWNCATRGCENTLRGHSDFVMTVAVAAPHDKSDNNTDNSSDNNQQLYIISSSIDETVKVWDLTTGACINTLDQYHHSYIYAVAASPDGTRFASVSDDKTVVLYTASLADLIPNFFLFQVWIFAERKRLQHAHHHLVLPRSCVWLIGHYALLPCLQKDQSHMKKKTTAATSNSK